MSRIARVKREEICCLLRSIAAGEAECVALKRAGHGQAQDKFDGKKVLVVAAQPAPRDIAGRILADPGCDVHTVENSALALDCLQSGADLDRLFADIVMPVARDTVNVSYGIRHRRTARCSSTGRVS